MKIFLVAPLVVNDDPTEVVNGNPTETTYQWAENLDRRLAGRGIECVRLMKEGCLRKKLEVALKKDMGSPGILVYLDHGCCCTLFGSDDKPIIDLKNIQLLKNKFVFALACDSANFLGKIGVAEYGVKGYLGFRDEVIIPKKIPGLEEYIKDYERCLLSGLMAMLVKKVNSKQCKATIVKRISEKILEYDKRLFEKLAKKTATIDDWNMTPQLITWLGHNRNCITLIGAQDWKYQRNGW